MITAVSKLSDSCPFHCCLQTTSISETDQTRGACIFGLTNIMGKRLFHFMYLNGMCEAVQLQFDMHSLRFSSACASSHRI